MNAADARSAVEAYSARRWRLVEIQGKVPKRGDWPAGHDLDAVERSLLCGNGVGVVLGEPSGGLVDVDLDCPEAVAAAGVLLPQTKAIFGRESRPRSHRLYVSPGSMTRRYASPDGAIICELRAGPKPVQTRLPPSPEEDGRRVRWDVQGEPAIVEPAALARDTALVAAAALLARYWPGEGRRHEAHMAVAGWLLREAMDPREVTRFLTAISSATRDGKEGEHANTVQDTAERIRAREPTTGAPHVKTLLGPRIVDRVAKWLSTRTTQADGIDGVAHICAASIEPRTVEWLWQNYIPRGMLTVLDGDPGVGKSTLSIDLAARVSTAALMPDGSSGVSGGVVIASCEDDASRVIVPRLIAAGADLARVQLMLTERWLDLSALDPLREAARVCGAVLIIIDPLMAYLPEDIDAHKDQRVRRVLAKLAELAAETGAAIVVLRHLRKAEGSALHRGGGSIGIIGAARSALLVAPDPEDPERRVLAATKANLAPSPTALAYRLVPAGAVARVKWLGPVGYTADDLLPASRRRGVKLSDAAKWLNGRLGSGEMPASICTEEARLAGISGRTLDRARKKLRVMARKDGSGPWVWSLPSSAAQ